MSLRAALRLLPRTTRGVAPLLAAAGRDFCGRHLQAKARLRPGGRRHGGDTPVALGLALSASLFSQEAEEETEKDAQEGRPEDAEEEIIYLLKKAKVCIMKGEFEEAERLLHEAARLSHQSNNRNGVIYTYDTMANLAFLRGQLNHAEKLFKATMSFLLAGNMEQDDNAVIEMSLKLASIYAAQDQEQLALAGYQFCILTLKEKIAKQKDMDADALPAEEERINTHLLLGMSLDSYARYLLAHKQAAAAERMYEQALQISVEVQGETHPRTVVLMNDLASALDAQGRYDDAYVHVRRASDLAQQTQHPEAYIVLNNLAGILMHKEDFSQARQVYKEALKQAEEAGDGAIIRYIRKELAELARRQKLAKSAENSAKEGQERGKD